jgi:hypothetical protein
MIISGSINLAADKPKKVLLKTSSKESYAEYLLPSRIPTMSLSDIKSVPGSTQFSPIKDYYEDLLTAEIDIGNNQFTFMLERDGYEPGKKSKAKLLYTPVAMKLKTFWETELTRKAPEGVKDMSQSLRLKYFLSGINPLAKEKAEKFADRLTSYYIKTGKPSKGKHYAEGYAYPIPTGLGTVEMNQLYNASVGKISTDFYIYDSVDWLEKLNKKGLKTKMAVVYPAGSNTYNWGYFRSATILKGEVDKIEIILFDDNLNNIYAEPGIDSIKVGGACITTVGSTISLKGKIYTFDTGLERKKKGNYITLTPAEVKTGKVQLQWDGNGAEVILAQIKSGSDYYPLFQVEEKKKSGGSKKKKKKAKLLSVTVPEGNYKLAGGAVKKEVDKKINYAFFDSGNPIEVKAGETTVVKLGEPYTAGIELISKGEDRIINCNYPTGAGGERYRWLLPRPERIRMTLKGEGEGFLEPIRKNMEMIDNGKVFLTRTFAYDPVLMVPENGPFNITVEMNPMVFDEKEVTIKRENMEVAKKKAKKKKAPKKKAKKKK